MAFCVISCRYRHPVWISYARLSPERVIAVGRRRPQRIDRPRDASLLVVDGLGLAAASVALRDLPAKRVVLVRRRHARLGARGNHESGARDSDGGKRRAGNVRRARHRVRRAVKAGARDGRVSARVKDLRLGDEDAARFVRHAKAGEPRARRRNARHAADEVGQTGALAVIEEERSMGDAAKQVTIPVRKVDSGASHAC